MSINLDQHYVKQFASNMQLLLQQKESKFKNAVMTGKHYGEMASPVDQIGEVSMNPVTGRFQTKVRTDAAVDRRWVAPQHFDLSQLIDHNDKLKLLLDPQSSYVQNAVAACNRQFDDLIIDAFTDAALTGKSGTTSTSILAANTVAVNFGSGSNVGLSVAKLREAKKILMENEVDLESDPIYCAISAEQHDDLLKESQIISLDFNDRPVLMDGKVTRFLGINFIQSERLNIDGSSYRKVPIWAKSGMHLGIWEDMVIDVAQNKELRGNPYEVYVMMTAGATRLEEEKVINVLCAE